jgi:hypothetical protein
MRGINGVVQIPAHWTVPMTMRFMSGGGDFRVLLPTFRFTDMYVPATPQRYIKSPERSHRRSNIILRSVVFNSCGVKYCCTNADRNDDQSISQNRARELLDFQLFFGFSSHLCAGCTTALLDIICNAVSPTAMKMHPYNGDGYDARGLKWD